MKLTLGKEQILQSSRRLYRQIKVHYLASLIIVLMLTILACADSDKTEGFASSTLEPTKDAFAAATGARRGEGSKPSDRRSSRSENSERERSNERAKPTPTPTPTPKPTPTPTPTPATPTANEIGFDNSHGNYGDDWIFDRGTVLYPNQLYGNEGNDHLVGSEGKDHLYGGAGDDLLWGRAGDDYMKGGTAMGGHDGWKLGNDKLYGGDDWDQLLSAELMVGGGDGDKCTMDQIPQDCDDITNPMTFAMPYSIQPPYEENTLIVPWRFSDTILFEEDDCDLLVEYVIHGNQSVPNNIKTLADNSFVTDISGVDVNSATEEIYQNGVFLGKLDSADIMIGTEKADYIDARGGNDVVCGRGGDDVIYGGDGNDRLYGGDGRDILYGEDGRDILWGGLGDDQKEYGLQGGPGGDWIDGGPGSDRLVGGAGEDVLYGRNGNDHLWGDSQFPEEYESDNCPPDPNFEKVAVLFTPCTDWLIGGFGNDLLHGGPGADIMQGDVFP